MEGNILEETVKELDRSAKLIRDLVADLIKLRRSLLKAYSNLSRLVEEPELLKQAPSTPLTPQPQLVEAPPPTPPPPVQPPLTPQVSVPAALSVVPPAPREELPVKGELAPIVKELMESIKSNPQASNIATKLSAFKENIEKKYIYHPVLSEVKLVISKFQSIPGSSVLSEGEVEELLKKILNWASRISQ
ncbi:MAG: hypothetical protein QXX87_01745 [Candidatus Jordarchaeales archaeon]